MLKLIKARSKSGKYKVGNIYFPKEMVGRVVRISTPSEKEENEFIENEIKKEEMKLSYKKLNKKRTISFNKQYEKLQKLKRLRENL